MSGRSTTGLRAVVLAGVFVLAGQAAFSQVVDPELAAELATLGPQSRARVIVRFAGHGGPTVSKGMWALNKAARRASLVRTLKARASASRRSVEVEIADPAVSGIVELWGINGLALTANPRVILALAAAPDVARISLDTVVAEPLAATDSASAAEWNLELIGAPGLWAAGHDGSGVVVATMDSGVDLEHPDLGPRFRGGDNSWLDPYGEHDAPHDRSGHGTQVLGLMVGGDAGGTAIGVAPGARWMAVKIFDDSGHGTLSAIHEGFQWLLDPDGDAATDDAPDVVNGSWDLGNIGGCDLEFEDDLELLDAAGIAVVLSGGNYGPRAGSSVSPANNPSGFAVGAVDEVGLVASFSGSGPSACDQSSYPAVVAPGVRVRTADRTYGGVFPDSYVGVSGTSAAAPHVAGGMALLLSAYPQATVQQLERALTETAIDGGPSGPDDAYGSGIIDLAAASAHLAVEVEPACADLNGDGVPDCLEPACGEDRPCTRRGPTTRLAPHASGPRQSFHSHHLRSTPW